MWVLRGISKDSQPLGTGQQRKMKWLIWFIYEEMGQGTDDEHVFLSVCMRPTRWCSQSLCCVCEFPALRRTLWTCLWRAASLTVSCLQPAECRCPRRRGSRWKYTACVWSPSVSLRISHESTGSAAAPCPESWNITPGWSVLCCFLQTVHVHAQARQVSFFYFFYTWNHCILVFGSFSSRMVSKTTLVSALAVTSSRGFSTRTIWGKHQMIKHTCRHMKSDNMTLQTISPYSHELLCDIRALVAVAVLFDIKLLFFFYLFPFCSILSCFSDHIPKPFLFLVWSCAAWMISVCDRPTSTSTFFFISFSFLRMPLKSVKPCSAQILS